MLMDRFAVASPLAVYFTQCAFLNYFLGPHGCLFRASSPRYEKCKQRTHQREAAGGLFGTPVALETDFSEAHHWKC